MISCIAHDKVDCDNNTPDAKWGYKHFSAIRKLEGLTMPSDLKKEIQAQWA